MFVSNIDYTSLHVQKALALKQRMQPGSLKTDTPSKGSKGTCAETEDATIYVWL